MKTKVVHVMRDEFDVYIGRPHSKVPDDIQGSDGKWGNPFTIGVDGTREEVIEKYREYLHSRDDLMADIEDLRGKVMGCWCKPKSCHGDVLVEVIESIWGEDNDEEEEEDGTHDAD